MSIRDIRICTVTNITLTFYKKLSSAITLVCNNIPISFPSSSWDIDRKTDKEEENVGNRGQ